MVTLTNRYKRRATCMASWLELETQERDGNWMRRATECRDVSGDVAECERQNLQVRDPVTS
jgi:hypothetical protein